ncbi:MAG TPA: hypothetical protein VH539_02025, partial [Gemmatimonadaceae bacterium]
MSTLRVSCLALLAASALQAQSPSATSWRLTGLQTGEYGAAVDSTVAHSGQRSGRIDGFAAAPFGPASLTL